MKGQLRIESMYAFIQLDSKDNTEGIIAFLDPTTQMWMPMVGADLDKVEQLRPVAEVTARNTGNPVRLVHFTSRVEVEEIAP